MELYKKNYYKNEKLGKVSRLVIVKDMTPQSPRSRPS